MNDGKPNTDVWAIGDAARIEDAPLPATAQGESVSQSHLCLCTITVHLVSLTLLQKLEVAAQKAKYVLKSFKKLAASTNNENYTKPFRFINQGSLAYIGNW